jgi:SSS family solute:Na+ symporter
MRSVVFTDVVQFGVMIIAIPLLFNVGASQVGGLSNLLDLSLYGNKLCSPEKINFIEIGVLFFVYSLMGLAPSFVQRLLIVKDTKQAFRSVFISALIYFPFLTLVIGIGIIAFNLKPDLDANFALPYLIDSLLPIGLKGLLIVGILSAIMSTADSDLNIIGISLVNDVILPFRKSKLIDKQEIVLARAITFTFGIISIFIPLYFKSILDIVVFVVNFWAPTMFVPLAMAILGRKVSPKAFFTCLCLGLSSTLMYHYFAQNKYEAGPIVGILTNLLTFCTCYKFEQKRLRF